MTHSKKDPLVFVLRAIIGFMMGTLAFAMLMLAVSLFVMPILHADVATEIAKRGADITAWQAIGLFAVLIAAIIVLLGLIEYFLLLLWRLLATVREGDPFAPINAERLSQMAWTALAANLFAVPLAIYGAWLARFFEAEVARTEVSFNFGSGGLLLVLVLFVLARVFRTGTEMRADLEGTV